MGFRDIDYSLRVNGDLSVPSHSIKVGSDITINSTDGKVTALSFAGDGSLLTGLSSSAMTDVLKLDGSRTMTSGLSVNTTGAHLSLEESEVRKWHLESVNGTFKIVESGVASRISIDAGGATTIGGNLTVGSNNITGTTINATSSLQENGTSLSSKYALQTTAISTGDGLTGGGDLSTSRTLSVSFAGTGTATTAARSDHHHDTSYDNYSSWKLSVNTETTPVNITSGATVDFEAGSNVTLSRSGNTITISSTDTDTNTWRPIDTSPVDGSNHSITSNWAFDHNASVGNKGHIPALGTSGQFLAYDGTWQTPPDTNTDTNYYLTGVSGSGNGTVTFTRHGLTGLSWDASHTHDERYLKLTGGTLTGTLNTEQIHSNGNIELKAAGTADSTSTSHWSRTLKMHASKWNGTAAEAKSGYIQLTSDGGFYFVSDGSGSSSNVLNISNAGHLSSSGTTKATAFLVGTTTVIESDAKIDWGRIKNTPTSYPPSTHNHDNLYYTESEVDALLSGKSDSNHDHNYDNYSHWNLKINSETTGTNILSGNSVDFSAGENVTISRSGNVITISSTDTNTDTNTWRPIDDTPVNGVTNESISSNWAYDTQQKLDGHIATPSAPTNLVLEEVSDEVQITFTLPTDGVATHYEVWSSIGVDGEYGLLGRVEAEDIPSADTTVTVLDNTYAAKTTVYYKVHAINHTTKSTALTGSIVLANVVADPLNMTVTEGISSFAVQYDIPDDRRLSHVEIYKHAAADLASLSEASATLAYSGLSDTFVYEIPDADLDLYHQFWVSSITRS